MRALTTLEIALVNKIRAQNDMEPLTIEEALTHTKYFTEDDWIKLEEELEQNG